MPAVTRQVLSTLDAPRVLRPLPAVFPSASKLRAPASPSVFIIPACCFPSSLASLRVFIRFHRQRYHCNRCSLHNALHAVTAFSSAMYTPPLCALCPSSAPLHARFSASTLVRLFATPLLELLRFPFARSSALQSTHSGSARRKGSVDAFLQLQPLSRSACRLAQLARDTTLPALTPVLTRIRSCTQPGFVCIASHDPSISAGAAPLLSRCARHRPCKRELVCHP